MNNDPNQKKIDDLVAMLDRLMEEGGGHVNVQVEEEEGDVQVETVRSTDCSLGKGACAQPTELPIDEE